MSSRSTNKLKNATRQHGFGRHRPSYSRRSSPIGPVDWVDRRICKRSGMSARTGEAGWGTVSHSQEYISTGEEEIIASRHGTSYACMDETDLTEFLRMHWTIGLDVQLTRIWFHRQHCPSDLQHAENVCTFKWETKCLSHVASSLSRHSWGVSRRHLTPIKFLEDANV